MKLLDYWPSDTTENEILWDLYQGDSSEFEGVLTFTECEAYDDFVEAKEKLDRARSSLQNHAKVYKNVENSNFRAMDELVTALEVDVPPLPEARTQELDTAERVYIELDTPPRRRQANPALEQYIYQQYLRRGYNPERDRQRREGSIMSPPSVSQRIYGTGR